VVQRRTSLSRKSAGEVTEEQVLAANLDLIFIVGALGAEPNLRRLERYVTVAWESGAEPVVLLTKADLSQTPEADREQVEGIAPGVPVLVSSSLTGEGIDLIRGYLRPGLTAVLIGPSGAGKSSIINRLTGGAIPTQAVRDDGRGRHTTTHRELLMVPGGGMIIDTPGLREVQLWHAESGLAQTFTDIEELAAGCRFNDCRHQSEPGCMVRRALEDRRLSSDRLASYRKLERELRSLEVRDDHRLQMEERKRWAAIHREARARSKRKY
jgi:ribosome biogenesis GTPase